MSFSMMGSRGKVRHRIHPRKVKGPSGYKGDRALPVVTGKRTHTKLYDEPKKGLFAGVLNKAKSLFRRGAK